MKKKILSILLALCMVLCMIPSVAAAGTSAGVQINSTNFPDAIFRNYVYTNFDKDKDSYLSKEEIANAETVSVTNTNVASLSGIENLSSLKRLYCDKTKLTAIDLSRNTNLITLMCGNSGFDSLDLSSNIALKYLYCNDSDLTELDLKENTALIQLSCENNAKMTSIKLNGCTALTNVVCQGNFALKEIDLSGCDALAAVDCQRNGLLSLDISDKKKLEVIDCSSNNDLVFLNLSGADALTNVTCNYTSLKTLDASAKPKLQRLECKISKLSSLDLSGDTALVYLNCEGNAIQTLDLSQNVALEELDCSENQIEDPFDLSKNVALTSLDCIYNRLDSLDTSYNTALATLNCSFNTYLSKLNVSGNNELVSLRCSNGSLSKLDVSGNTKLQYLDCSNNRLTSMDLSKNTQLTGFSGSSASYASYLVNITSDREFDLTKLPGKFELSKASNWEGGSVTGTTLTFEEGTNTVSYKYDCGNEKTATFKLAVHEHTEYGEWVSNGSGTHSRNCAVVGCVYTGTEKCSGGNATCTEQATCTICGEKYGDVDLTNHIGGTEVKDAEAATCTETGYTGDTYCTNCNAKISDGSEIEALGHEESETYKYDKTSHWKICLREGCDETFDAAEHSGGVATIEKPAECEICGQPYGRCLPGSATISGTIVTAKLGKEITVDLNLETNTGLASMLVELDYDKSILEFVSAENGEVFSDESFTGTQEESETQVLSWINGTSKENITATGKLAILKFRIKNEAAAGNYEISFKCSSEKYEAIDAEMNAVNVTANPAEVTVVNFYYGDVDGNDSVDSSDVLWLKRYLAKWKGYTINEEAADLDSDEAVTLRDITILQRYIAGWTGYDKLPVTEVTLPVADTQQAI